MPNTTTIRKIFCDLDGVLCDFDAGVLRIFKRDVSSIALRELWMRLAHYKSPEGHGFFDTLQWTGNGPKVWEILQDLRPTILTGLPRGNWAEKQKRRWCKENLGEHVPVICCLSKEKFMHSRQGCILIDDRISLKADWVRRDGLFFHHTDTQHSIERLKGVLLVKHLTGNGFTTISSDIALPVDNVRKGKRKKVEPHILDLFKRGGGGGGVKKQRNEISVEEEERDNNSEKNS